MRFESFSKHWKYSLNYWVQNEGKLIRLKVMKYWNQWSVCILKDPLQKFSLLLTFEHKLDQISKNRSAFSNSKTPIELHIVCKFDMISGSRWTLDGHLQISWIWFVVVMKKVFSVVKVSSRLSFWHSKIWAYFEKQFNATMNIWNLYENLRSEKYLTSSASDQPKIFEKIKLFSQLPNVIIKIDQLQNKKYLKRKIKNFWTSIRKSVVADHTVLLTGNVVIW